MNSQSSDGRQANHAGSSLDGQTEVSLAEAPATQIVQTSDCGSIGLDSSDSRATPSRTSAVRTSANVVRYQRPVVQQQWLESIGKQPIHSSCKDTHRTPVNGNASPSKQATTGRTQAIDTSDISNLTPARHTDNSAAFRLFVSAFSKDDSAQGGSQSPQKAKENSTLTPLPPPSPKPQQGVQCPPSPVERMSWSNQPPPLINKDKPMYGRTSTPLLGTARLPVASQDPYNPSLQQQAGITGTNGTHLHSPIRTSNDTHSTSTIRPGTSTKQLFGERPDAGEAVPFTLLAAQSIGRHSPVRFNTPRLATPALPSSGGTSPASGRCGVSTPQMGEGGDPKGFTFTDLFHQATTGIRSPVEHRYGGTQNLDSTSAGIAAAAATTQQFLKLPPANKGSGMSSGQASPLVQRTTTLRHHNNLHQSPPNSELGSPVLGKAVPYMNVAQYKMLEAQERAQERAAEILSRPAGPSPVVDQQMKSLAAAAALLKMQSSSNPQPPTHIISGPGSPVRTSCPALNTRSPTSILGNGDLLLSSQAQLSAGDSNTSGGYSRLASFSIKDGDRASPGSLEMLKMAKKEPWHKFKIKPQKSAVEKQSIRKAQEQRDKQLR